MILSRLNILSGLSGKLTIPLCVNKYLGEIRPVQIEFPPNDHQWSDLAKYVNQNVEWDYQSLVNAFNFLIGFEDFELNSELPELIFDTENDGLQRPDNQYILNCGVVFKILSVYNIKLKLTDSYHDMCKILKQLYLPTEIIISDLRKQLYLQSKSTLINIWSQLDLQSDQPKTETKGDKLNLSYLYDRLTNIVGLQTLIEPSTDDGAIALAAILYKIDISISSDPIKEYKFLQMGGNYIPYDPTFREYYDKRPDLYSLKLNFQPLLPKEYYSQQDLEKIAINMGVSRRGDIYQNLQLHCLTNNFYQGLLPEIKLTQTLISWDQIDQIPKEALFSYGKRNEKLYPICLDEIIESLEKTGISDPFNKDSCLSILSLETLKSLINNNCKDSEKFRYAYELISIVQGISEDEDIASKNLIDYYKRSSTNEKKEIRSLLQLLLDLAMYMRGWLGPDHEYPIGTEANKISNQYEIDIRTTFALNLFRDAVKNFDLIGNLPLVYYKDGYYIASDDQTEGFTINDRIKIVYEGRDTKNVNSCIRLTSNWLAASAHKYLKVIGQPPAFSIDRMVRVS